MVLIRHTVYFFMSCGVYCLFFIFRSSELARSLTIGILQVEKIPSMFSEDDLLISEYDVFCLGKSYFDSKEYSRAAHYLKDCKSSTAKFLYYYSRYMVRTYCTVVKFISSVK